MVKGVLECPGSTQGPKLSAASLKGQMDWIKLNLPLPRRPWTKPEGKPLLPPRAIAAQKHSYSGLPTWITTGVPASLGVGGKAEQQLAEGPHSLPYSEVLPPFRQSQVDGVSFRVCTGDAIRVMYFKNIFFVLCGIHLDINTGRSGW